jgi:hypothetical protein
MTQRALAVAGAALIAGLAGSIENNSISFAGATVLIMIYWFLLNKVMI